MEKQEYKIEDIFDLKALQKLMDALAQSFEVGIGIRNPSGGRIIRDSFYCTFCSEVIQKSKEAALQPIRSGNH